MAYHCETLTSILKTINKFNESIARNCEGIKFKSFELRYCVKEDTIHSFNKGECYNCARTITPSIPLSEKNLIFFAKRFGENDFYSKLIELIDNWSEKNFFPFEPDSDIEELEEHEELKRLLGSWKRLSLDDKFDEIADLYASQKKSKANAIEE